MLFSKIMYGIIITSFIIIFVLFNLIESDARDKIRSELVNDQEIHGETMTKHNAHLISNEFVLILEKQKELALYVAHSQHDLSLDISEFALDAYDNIDSRMDIFSLSILDKDNIIKIRVKNGTLTEEFVGQDTSEVKFVKEFNEKQKPLISDVFLGLDGKPRIASKYPIFDEYDELIGSIHVIINPTSFFQHYDAIYGLPPEVLTIVDKNQQFVKHSIPELIGENMFDEKIQSQLNIGKLDNETNELMRKSFSGNDVSFIFEFDGNKKLTFMQPIFLNDDQIFTIILSIPLEKIYSKPQAILFSAEYVVYILIGVTGLITLISFHFIQKQFLKREELQKFSIIGELSARIAHDIRNPLNNIKLSADLVSRKNSDEKLKPYFETIDKNISRISHQVKDVLDFLRKNPIKKESVNIKVLIDNVIDSIQIPANISTDVSDCSFNANVDKIMMESAFSNLILNSIQIIGDKNGKITVSIKEKDSQYSITIEDSGEGIDSKIIDKIFDPLFSTKMEGTGLGLASVKAIIEAHGGTIYVKNNPTTFTITLPKILD
jgi:signal transduction histidine kinase